MRHLCVSILLSLACACGGGGSGSTANNGGGGGGGGGSGGGGSGGGGTPEEQVIQQILESCGVLRLQQYFEFLRAIEATLDPAGTTLPAFNGIAVDQAGGGVTAMLDLDGDLADDYMVAFQFLDDQGQPAAPFDLTPLAGGFGNLDSLVAAVPDGWSLSVNLLELLPGDPNALLTFSFSGGAPELVNADATAPDPLCSSILMAEDIPFGDLAGDWPTMSFSINLATVEGNALGTATISGTSVARLELQLTTIMYTFDVDLATGTVTLVP